jgi:digalactosyldiacylglycerol synthase
LGIFAPEKELVENVHGVRQTFLDYGTMLCDILQDEEQRRSNAVFGSEAKPTIYFIGKMLWSKGIGSLMDLMKYAEDTSGLKLQIDMYGGGPDKDDAELRAKRLNLNMTFHGPIDHAALSATHKVRFLLKYIRRKG